MSGAAVSLVLVADEPSSRAAAQMLFSDLPAVTLGRAELRPAEPFAGRLFAGLAACPRGSLVGLVVPVMLSPEATELDGTLFAVDDHVNLELRGPLTGRWPDGVTRDFPSMTGVYQPAVVRAAGGARVYSCGIVVAGVADARDLTPFESRVVRERGLSLVSDVLVPAAMVAAYYGLYLAACGVTPAPAHDRE